MSMIQPLSGLVSGAAQWPAAVKEVKAPPEARRPEDESQVRPLKPAVDEYVPEEKQEPSGRYWIGRDEGGQPKVYFDDPERDEGAKPEAAGGPRRKAADGRKAETCTGSTDQVDREIERLKKKKERLEQQINSETDEAKKKELEAKLAQVENELRQKDNDAYRRQHMVVSRQS